MHMDAVADDFRRNLPARQDRACESGIAMAERRHPIEQMRRMPRACADCGARLVQCRSGVAERNPTAVRHEMPYQIERTVKFRRERDDPHAVTGGVDFRKNVTAIEVVLMAG